MGKQCTPTHRRNKEVFHLCSSVPCKILRFTVQNMFNVANIYSGQKISLRCTYFVFCIFSSNEKSCAAIPLHFHVVPATYDHIYRIVGLAFLLPADVRPCPAVSATTHSCFIFKFPAAKVCFGAENRWKSVGARSRLKLYVPRFCRYEITSGVNLFFDRLSAVTECTPPPPPTQKKRFRAPTGT
jgi:hypothetical protein